MITRPSGWTLLPSADHYTLVAPEGPMAAAIRYVERVRPLRRLGDIVDDWLSKHKKLSDVTIGEAERIVTVEGEYGAFVTISGSFNQAPAEVSIGVVFGDDFYSRIEGFAIRDDQFERVRTTVRKFTKGDRHILGTRRRRYLYSPAPGWQPLVRGFVTDWIAPGFPTEWAVVTVHPATPSNPVIESDIAGIFNRAIEQGFEPEAATPPTQVENPHGLVGVVAEMTGVQQGARVLRALAAMSDYRHVYALDLISRAEASWSEHREAFATFWRSIEAIPKPQTTSEDALGFWAE